MCTYVRCAHWNRISCETKQQATANARDICLFPSITIQHVAIFIFSLIEVAEEPRIQSFVRKYMLATCGTTTKTTLQCISIYIKCKYEIEMHINQTVLYVLWVYCGDIACLCHGIFHWNVNCKCVMHWCIRRVASTYICSGCISFSLSLSAIIHSTFGAFCLFFSICSVAVNMANWWSYACMVENKSDGMNECIPCRYTHTPARWAWKTCIIYACSNA